MRWPVFFIAAYVLLGLQVGLSGALGVTTSWGVIEPRFVLPLAVFVGLWAGPTVALVAWASLGILLDLTTVWPTGLTLIGPYALGYLAAGYVLLQLRSMLVRRHPLTLAAMTVVCGVAAHLVVVGVFAVRNFYDPLPQWTGSSELLVRSLSMLYTAGIALVLAIPLDLLSGLFGFHTPKPSLARRSW